ncbi:MAG: TetR/AcrR family transcriptional regulator [Bacillota bacterium]
MSPKTKEQNEAIRSMRKSQILKAGMEVYLEKGVHAMEMGDVAQRAEVGRGTVYHYYKNKYELMKDVIRLSMEDSIKTIEDILMVQGDP